MSKHKLYRNSNESTILNFSPEVEANMDMNPYQGKDSTDEVTVEADGNEIENCATIKREIKDDSFDENFLSEISEKRPYSFEEDVEILNFVLKDQNIYRVSSILLWKYLEAKKRNPKRTYHSLKNRFLRNIKPKLFSKYRHLITTQDQIDKILMKFPELQKEMKTKEPLGWLKSKKKESKVMINKDLNPESVATSSGIKKAKPIHVSGPLINPQVDRSAFAAVGPKKKITFANDSIYVTVPRSLNTDETSLRENAGIYQRYLNCKAKYKSIPCSFCGRSGSPELEPIEIISGENENDEIISNSIQNKYFQDIQTFQSSTESTMELSLGEDAETEAINARTNKSVQDKTPSSSSRKSTRTPTLLDLIKAAKREKAEARRKKAAAAANAEKERVSGNSTQTTTTSSGPSCAKYLTPEENAPDRVTRTSEELDSNRQKPQNSVKNIVDSQEEEALCGFFLKKNRDLIGFGKAALKNRESVEAFFLQGLYNEAGEPLVPTQTTSQESPLVQNMKRMLKPTEQEK